MGPHNFLVKLILMLVAAVLIGCSGAGDEDSLDSEDGGATRSEGRGRAGGGGDDDGNDVGKLGARAGRGSVDAGVEPDAGEPAVEPDSGQAPDAEDDEPCMPGEFVCIAGSCTACETVGGSGAAGSAGAAAGSGGSGASCSDGDADGVCDADDQCPGPDQDADDNGFPDGCDQVLFEARMLPTTERVGAPPNQIGGVYGALHSNMVLLDSLTTSSPMTWSFAADSDDIQVERAVAFFAGNTWNSNASICVKAPTGVGGPCWRSKGALVDLTKKTITRFVLSVDEVQVTARSGDFGSSDVRAGGRWEIRGY
jgi:hypothetical protein